MERLPIDHADAILRATRALDAGELVVLPADAEYVLAADALNDDAVQRVFDVKRRGADRALPVCVSGAGDVRHVAHLTPLARRLAERHWPGQLTLVLRAQAWLPDELTAGSGTVAVRSPALAFPRDLAAHFGPIVATGAGRDGAGAMRTVDDAHAMLGGDVQLFLDGGAREGARSTVVDATGSEAKVLREGALAATEIAAHGSHGD